MNIWLTGSAGFLGARLVPRLVGEGHRVLGLSRGHGPEGILSKVLDLAGLDAVKALEMIPAEWGPPETIIHAAGRTMGPGGWADFIRDNLQTTANLIDLTRSRGPVRFIYISTLDLYGRPGSIPVREEDPVHPAHPYHWSKLWAEQALTRAGLEGRVAIIRLPSLFGTGQEDSFVDGLARVALKNEPLELFAKGEIIRDALHVEDAVQGIVGCLEASLSRGATTLNLGCGRPLSVLEWTRALVEALNSKSAIIPVDRPTPGRADLYTDIAKAERLIGFSPTPLKETMERYARELQAQS